MEDETVKLPDYNPTQICPKCGKEYPVWKIGVGVLDGKPYLANNFCPASAPDGKIVYLCIQCKMADNARRNTSHRGEPGW